MREKSASESAFSNVRVLLRLLTLLTGCFLTLTATAQEVWVARYKGPGNARDTAWAVAVDASGNVYVTGASVGSGTGLDYATIKYNSSGIQQWVARYNGSGNSGDEATAIAVDGSGNVYVTGYSTGPASGYDYATIKYNSSGIQQWVARYDGPGNGTDLAFSIAVDGSGNVYVTGFSTGPASGYDYATIKYNSSGIQQWVARYDGPGIFGDVGRAIAVDASGNVYVTGESMGSGSGYDYATIKYNSSGTQQWVDRYNGPGNGDDKIVSPGAIAIDASGNAYVTGESTNLNGDYDYATIKYWSCWPACTTGAKKDSFTFARRHAISDRHRAVWPESRIGRIAKKDWKSTDSLKNSRKRLDIN